jgi:hypothetical protein
VEALHANLPLLILKHGKERVRFASGRRADPDLWDIVVDAHDLEVDIPRPWGSGALAGHDLLQGGRTMFGRYLPLLRWLRKWPGRRSTSDSKAR